jgi:hypothetical protein
MASTTARPTAKLSVACLLLGALAAAPAVFAQSRFGADAQRRQAIAERIEQEERTNGPHSETLIGPLSDLALLYQDTGDHDLAIAVITRVRQVVRVNEGLHSLEQIPLIQQMIANAEAMGRFDAAWELEEDLLTLARRHPDDMRTVPVFREAATKRMTLLHRYLGGEFPPQMVLGCYYAWPRDFPIDALGCIAGDRGTAIRGIVSDAQEHYYNAITVMLRNELYSSDELRALELDLVASVEAIRGRRDPRQPTPSSRRPADYAYDDLPDIPADREPYASWWQNIYFVGEALDGVARRSDAPTDYLPLTVAESHPPYGGWDYTFGRKSLERLSAYATATSAPLQERARALIRIADWDLLYTQNSRALKQYQRAFEMLKLAEAQALIDELFAPETPVVLPTLVSNPLAPNALQTTGAYIDVAFEVNRYGESRRIEILDTTTNAADADKTNLVQLIQRSRFRPRVSNGELARSAPVVLRYYITE